jgi:hypothetical protein
VRVQRGIDLLDDRGCQAVAADHHDGRQVMGIGAFFLALGRCQLDGRHRLIIPAA